MSYIIKYDYNAGCSEYTEHDIVKTLELKFDSLDVAKENLHRIKEHYTYYQKKREWGTSKKDIEKLNKEAFSKDWSLVEGGRIKYDFIVILKADIERSEKSAAYYQEQVRVFKIELAELEG